MELRYRRIVLYLSKSRILYGKRKFVIFFDRSHNEENLFWDRWCKKFFLTHGHLYSVKRSLSSIKEIGKKLNVSLVIFWTHS